jgi:hypothetical protein
MANDCIGEIFPERKSSCLTEGALRWPSMPPSPKNLQLNRITLGIFEQKASAVGFSSQGGSFWRPLSRNLCSPAWHLRYFSQLRHQKKLRGVACIKEVRACERTSQHAACGTSGRRPPLLVPFPELWGHGRAHLGQRAAVVAVGELK